MSKSRLEWKVGLFVLVGLVLLGALALQFTKGITFRHTYTILLRAVNLGGGLKLRAQVLMAGVEVGRVSDIRLGPAGTNVTISLRLFSQYRVHKDARFLIEQSGFLGDQYIAIIPTQNQGDFFEEGDVAQAEAPFNLLEVARSTQGFLQRIDMTAQGLNDAIADVRRLLLNEQTLTNFASAVANLRIVSERALGTLGNVDALLASNSPALSTAGTNLVNFSHKIDEFADGLSGVLATNREQLAVAMKNVETSTDILKTMLNDLQAGKGLAGNLLKNEQLAARVSQIANNLSITSSNLNRLGLWGILWQHKPPRTNPPAPPPRVLSSPKETD